MNSEGSVSAAQLRMDWERVPPVPCPVSSTLDLVGDRWSLLIVRDVMNGVRRFDGLTKRLGIGRATLSARLRQLVDDGILETADYLDRRGRTRSEYRLTDRGWALRHVVVALRDWGDAHVIGEGNELLHLVDRTSGRPVRLAFVDDTGSEVDDRDVMTGPGPGFPASALVPADDAPVNGPNA
ncbi:MAG: winged helix-turn-helix transcriptional regulator [Acidimicrobiales bacterium]